MNRFVKTALAIAVASSAAHAGTGDNEWAALDSEISGLASSLKPSSDGLGWSALIRAVYSYSSGDISTGDNGPDTSGFGFNDIDLAFWGAQGPYSWRVSADLDGNGFEFDSVSGMLNESSSQIWLEDAYVRWNCSDYLDVRLGNFKPHVTSSNSVDPEKQLFIDRTVLGSAFDRWDTGVDISGHLEAFRWYFALTNGYDGHESDHFYAFRAEFDLGSGAGEYEGALGSSDMLNATVGVSYLMDDTFEGLVVDADGDGTPDTNGTDFNSDGDVDNSAWVLDFNGSVANFGFGFEIARFDRDFAALTSSDYNNLYDTTSGSMNPAGFPFLVLEEDSTPRSITASYLITPEVEVAGRFENVDNGSLGDNTVLSFGLNWYRPNAAGRWQVQWSQINAADDAFNEGSILQVGYAIGATR